MSHEFAIRPSAATPGTSTAATPAPAARQTPPGIGERTVRYVRDNAVLLAKGLKDTVIVGAGAAIAGVVGAVGGPIGARIGAGLGASAAAAATGHPARALANTAACVIPGGIGAVLGGITPPTAVLGGAGGCLAGLKVLSAVID